MPSVPRFWISLIPIIRMVITAAICLALLARLASFYRELAGLSQSRTPPEVTAGFVVGAILVNGAILASWRDHGLTLALLQIDFACLMVLGLFAIFQRMEFTHVALCLQIFCVFLAIIPWSLNQIRVRLAQKAGWVWWIKPIEGTKYAAMNL